MTVADLIKKLQHYPASAKILTEDDSGAILHGIYFNHNKEENTVTISVGLGLADIKPFMHGCSRTHKHE